MATEQSDWALCYVESGCTGLERVRVRSVNSAGGRKKHEEHQLMIILLLFLQKQNLAFAVYLFGSVLSSKRLFRGPSTNDMKK